MEIVDLNLLSTPLTLFLFVVATHTAHENGNHKISIPFTFEVFHSMMNISFFSISTFICRAKKKLYQQNAA